MSDLSTGEVIAIVVSIVLSLVLVVALYICRLVYLHEHGSGQVKDDLKKKVLRKMRSRASTESMRSGSTDNYVDRRDFDQLFSGWESPWQTSVDDIEEGITTEQGDSWRIDNPAFDSERGKQYDAAVRIQSLFRGHRYRLVKGDKPLDCM